MNNIDFNYLILARDMSYYSSLQKTLKHRVRHPKPNPADRTALGRVHTLTSTPCDNGCWRDVAFAFKIGYNYG